MTERVQCSLIYDGSKMVICSDPFPTLEMIEAVVAEKKPAEMSISDWFSENDFAVIDGCDYNTVTKLNGWCIDYDG